MKWIATAVWGVTDVTINQLLHAADDLDGDAGYDPVTGFPMLRFELIATTHDEAVAITTDLTTAMLLPQRVASLTVQPWQPRAPVVDSRCHVDALVPEMTGMWLVKTQGSEHIWNLDHSTYTRLPGSRSRSGTFAFDHQPMAITRVERWPRVGFTSLVWYADPTNPLSTEHWRRSSRIVAITRIDREKRCGCHLVAN